MQPNIKLNSSKFENYALNIGSNIMNKTSTEFNDMFNKAVDKFNSKQIEVKTNVDRSKIQDKNNVNKRVDKKLSDRTSVDKASCKDEVKNVDKTKKIDEVNNNEKDDSEEKEKKKIQNDAYMQVLSAVLDAMTNPKFDMENAIDENIDGTFKVKLDGVEKIINVFKEDVTNKIDDVKNLLEDFGFDFSEAVKDALDFIMHEANLDMPAEDIKSLEVENNGEILGILNVDPDVKNIGLDNINLNSEESKDDISMSNNFDKLKATINDLIDEIKVEKDNENNTLNRDEILAAKESLEKTGTKMEITENDTLDVNLDTSMSSVNENIDMQDNNASSENESNSNEDSNSNQGMKYDNPYSVNSTPNEAYSLDASNFDLNNNSNFTMPKNVESKVHQRESITDRFLDNLNVTKQMVKGMELKITENFEEMSIKLDPENLGKVNLKLITENGLVTAKFEAESQKVKEIIETNLSLLKESLENKGISVSNLEVNVGQNMSGNSKQNDDIEYMRKVLKEKNPHKILQKSIKTFNSFAEINNDSRKTRGLYATRSQVNIMA